MDSNNVFVPRPNQLSEGSEVSATEGTSSLNNLNIDYKKKYEEKKERERLSGIKNFEIFGLYTVLYAVFATFCLFKNARGVSFPFFTAGTLFYFVICIKKFGVELKKKNTFLIVSIMLLGFSMFLTEDHQMTGLAKWTMFVLLLIFTLHNCYDDSKWQLFSYLHAIGIYFGKIFEHLGTPFTDAGHYIREMKKKNSEPDENGVVKKNKLSYIVLGILISIPLLIVILNLLCEADAVFKEACKDILELIDIENVLGVTIMFVAVYMIFYAVMRVIAEKELEVKSKDRRIYEPILAITVTSIITVVYVLFCGIQVMYLFTKQLKLPEEYTYAEYAKEGFYQLLAVCILNLIIVLICTNLFRKHRALDIILTIISICTYIMIVSSAFRMYMYVNSYDLSRLRLYVIIGLAVLSVLMVGVVISIYRDSFHLFKYGLVVLTISIIITVYSHPSFIVAFYNVEHYKSKRTVEDSIDVQYLTELPLDAAPVILDVDNFKMLQEKDRWTSLKYYYEDFDPNDPYNEDSYITKRMSFRSFNLSKFLAIKSYEKLVTYKPYDGKGNGYNF